MAYTPTVWETGDVITAEKLNKAENGIAAASDMMFFVDYGETSSVLDKTAGEIKTACEAGKIVIFRNYDEEYIALTQALIDFVFQDRTQKYQVKFVDPTYLVDTIYEAASLTDYPTLVV